MNMIPNKIAFLLYEGIEEMDLVGVWEAFGLWRSDANGPAIITVAEVIFPIRCANGLQMVADFDFDGCPEFDTLVVPGGVGRKNAMNSDRLMNFLRERGSKCTYILSVCTGVFLLEKAGLIRGRSVTTHWDLLAALRNLGSVKVEEGVRYYRDGNIWSAAGITAGFDMALAFIDSFRHTLNVNGRQRTGDAGKVELYAEYIPSADHFNPELDLSDAPRHIINRFKSAG